jgi:hypothetical protein
MWEQIIGNALGLFATVVITLILVDIYRENKRKR